MKKIRISIELLDGSGEAVHSHERICRICEGVPTRPIPLMSNGSLMQNFTLGDLERFWHEIVMLGLLDEYIRDRHKPTLPRGE